MKKCPNCGAEAQTEVLFCKICGTKLVEVPAPSASRQACPNCGVEIDAQTSYCSMCGQKITRTRNCPSCGQEISPNAKFCKKCGWQFERETKPSARPMPSPATLPPPVPPPATSVTPVPQWPLNATAPLTIAVICIAVGLFVPLDFVAAGIVCYLVAVVCGLYVTLTQHQNMAARAIGAILAIISVVILAVILLFIVQS